MSLLQGGDPVTRPQNPSRTLVGPQVSFSLREVVHQSWGRDDRGNTCGQFAGQELGSVSGSSVEGQQRKPLALLLFPFPSSPINPPHFPRPLRSKELTGASLETTSLQQDFAFAPLEKVERYFRAKSDLQLKIGLPGLVQTRSKFTSKSQECQAGRKDRDISLETGRPPRQRALPQNRRRAALARHPNGTGVPLDLIHGHLLSHSRAALRLLQSSPCSSPCRVPQPRSPLQANLPPSAPPS